MQHTKYFLFICFFSCLLGEVWGQVAITSTWLDGTYCIGSDYLLYVEIEENGNSVDASLYNFEWFERADASSSFTPLFSGAGATSFLLEDLNDTDDNGKGYRVVITEIADNSNTTTSNNLNLTLSTATTNTNNITLTIDNALEICPGQNLVQSATLDQGTGGFFPGGTMRWYSGDDINSLDERATQDYSGGGNTPSPATVTLSSLLVGDFVYVQFDRDGPNCYSDVEGGEVMSAAGPAPTTGSYAPVCENATNVSLDMGSGDPTNGESWTWSGPGVSEPFATAFVFDPDANDTGPGTHTLTYTLTYSSGCTGSATTDIIVVDAPDPVSNIPSFPSSLCTDAGLQTLPAASPPGGTWSGNGVSGNMFDPSAMDVDIGGSGNTLTYTLENTASGITCTESDNITVIVNNVPNTNAGSDQTVCSNDAPFNLIGTPAGGEWSGDGVSMTGEFDPSDMDVVIGGSGNTLTYTYEHPTTMCTNSNDVVITVENPPVAADFTFGTSTACTNESLSIEVTGSPGLDVRMFADDAFSIPLGAEQTLDMTSGSASFPYPQALSDGSLTVYFRAKRGATCTSMAIPHTITVNDPPAQPMINGDLEICEGFSTSLTAVDMSGVSTPSFEWFNNSGTSVSSDANFMTNALTADRTFSVVMLEPSTGCKSDPLDVEVTVNLNPSAEIDFTAGDFACLGQNISFDNNSTAGGGTLTDATWDFGDNMTSNSTGSTIEHLYAVAGTYSVTLTVEDDNGCTSTETIEALIRALPDSIPETSIDRSVCVNADPISLPEPDGNLIYIWSGPCVDAGDKTFNPKCEDLNISTAVDTTLTVIIRDGFTCQDTFDYVYSIVPRPIADFTIDNTCLKSAFSPMDMSMNSPDSWVWFIGETLADTTEADSIFILSDPADVGTKTLKLIVNSDGCLDSISKPFVVYDLPEANFPSLGSTCPDEELRFASSSDPSPNNGPLSFVWDFGDGNTSTDEALDYVYASNVSDMELTVVLTVGEEVEDGLICYDMRSRKVNILPQPMASFFIEDTVCNSNQNMIVNLSEADGMDGIESVSWDPGDGSAGLVVFVEEGNTLLDTTFYTYIASETDNTFTSTLTVIGNSGCTDTITKTTIIDFRGPTVTDAPLLLATDLLVSRDDTPGIRYQWYKTCNGVTTEAGSNANNSSDTLQFYCVKDNEQCEYFVKTRIGTNPNSCETQSAGIVPGREGLPLTTFFRRGMKLYPSPNQGNFSLEFLHEATGSAQLLVTDMAGKQVYAETFEKTGTLYTHKVSLSGLAEGLYIAKVRMVDDVWFSQKMMVQ